MAQFRELLRILKNRRVDFIVVGGVSAALHGAMTDSLVLDLVHSRSPENIRRLCDVLDDVQAVYRSAEGRKLAPNDCQLAADTHQLLITRLGPLNVLGTIGSRLSYEDLLPNTTEMLIAEGVTVRVLNLATLIQIKEELSGEKDRAMLPVLKRTLAEQQKN